MDDVKTQVQNQSDPNKEPVTVHGAGSVESGPSALSVETPNQGVENSLDISSEEISPVIDDESREHGVEARNDFPEIPKEVKDLGVQESIPSPTFSNFPTNQAIVQQIVKTADVGTSDPWRALLVIKEFAKGLFGIKKPQEVN